MGERQQDAEQHADAALRLHHVLEDARHAVQRPQRLRDVGLWAVWNEPNIQLFLTPQFVGKRSSARPTTAKFLKAAYAGIKAGNPLAKVAIGETSARGRDKPLAGVSGSIAPGTFARLLGQVPGLKFDAWAHHPYPTSPNLPPLQKVRYPNVTLSTLPRFEKTLKTCVPPHRADLDHRVRPRDEAGRAEGRLDVDPGRVREAGAEGREGRSERADVHLVRLPGLVGQPVAERPRARERRAQACFAAFSAVAKLTDGQTVAARAGKAPAITIYVPYLSHYTATGTQIGVFYTVYDGLEDRRAGDAHGRARDRPVGQVRACVHSGEGSHVQRRRRCERAERPLGDAYDVVTVT